MSGHDAGDRVADRTGGVANLLHHAADHAAARGALASGRTLRRRCLAGSGSALAAALGAAPFLSAGRGAAAAGPTR
ncbi:MAG: hypothetical protein DMF57_12610 [Acidobacteria bacterium]|nr:MAG: hypothetical protein DMF57_12610 [Acidobacteriota bacterium]